MRWYDRRFHAIRHDASGEQLLVHAGNYQSCCDRVREDLHARGNEMRVIEPGSTVWINDGEYEIALID